MVVVQPMPLMLLSKNQEDNLMVVVVDQDVVLQPEK
jgi:hypothetical protein